MGITGAEQHCVVVDIVVVLVVVVVRASATKRKKIKICPTLCYSPLKAGQRQPTRRNSKRVGGRSCPF